MKTGFRERSLDSQPPNHARGGMTNRSPVPTFGRFLAAGLATLGFANTANVQTANAQEGSESPPNIEINKPCTADRDCVGGEICFNNVCTPALVPLVPTVSGKPPQDKTDEASGAVALPEEDFSDAYRDAAEPPAVAARTSPPKEQDGTGGIGRNNGSLFTIPALVLLGAGVDGATVHPSGNEVSSSWSIDVDASLRLMPPSAFTVFGTGGYRRLSSALSAPVGGRYTLDNNRAENMVHAGIAGLLSTQIGELSGSVGGQYSESSGSRSVGTSTSAAVIDHAKGSRADLRFRATYMRPRWVLVNIEGSTHPHERKGAAASFEVPFSLVQGRASYFSVDFATQRMLARRARQNSIAVTDVRVDNASLELVSPLLRVSEVLFSPLLMAAYEDVDRVRGVHGVFGVNVDAPFARAAIGVGTNESLQVLLSLPLPSVVVGGGRVFLFESNTELRLGPNAFGRGYARAAYF